MSKMFNLFSPTRLTTAGSSTSLSELDQVAALKSTLEGLDALLNDDLNGAEKILAAGSSAFHKTGHSAVSFLRALIGFEAEMLKEATERIVDAEATSERERKLAVKDNHAQGRYEPGSEYTLCIALCLLMSAVVSFLNESVVESLKGAYKLRKSYQLLHKMFDMIVEVDGTAPVDSMGSTTYPEKSTSTDKPGFTLSDSNSDSDSDDFVDATDDISELANPATLPESLESMIIADGETHSEQASIHVRTDDVLNTRPTSSSAAPITPNLDRSASIVTTATFHEIPTPPQSDSTLTDQTIYAGTLMALGSIMLLISLLPPSLSRILSIIGFRGSRSQALSMLWKVSGQPGPFGSLGTFVLGSYYGNIVQNSDIVSDEITAQRGNSGATIEKLHTSIVGVRRRYPSSALWAVEEARMESIKGNLDEVVNRLSSLKVNSQMPQIESLVCFEGALHYLMTHQYENAATWFIRMCSKNNWSHGLYTYIAGICYAELYRQHPTNKSFAEKATYHLDRVPTLLQKRKSFGGRRIPFEQFVERKLNRFKLKANGGNIVEGITGPVTEEVTYLLCNGQKRMGQKELNQSWESLELWHSHGCAEEESMAMELLKSVVDRNAGRLESARDRIEIKVIAEGINKRIAMGSNDWVPGFAYYEMAVITWLQKRPADEVRGWLKRASDQGEFPLSNRLSIRIQVAQETLKRK